MIGNKPLEEYLSGFWKTSAVKKKNKKWTKKIKLKKYSQTCVQQPSSGPKIYGRSWQVVVVQRWLLAKVWLYVSKMKL